MNPFTAIFNAYVRWRHSRGFGVHSPFAYRLVRMAVRPGSSYGYYGYADIDRVILAPGFKGYPQGRAYARLLLRLLVQLGTRRLILPEGLPLMLAAARAASVPTYTYPSIEATPATLPDRTTAMHLPAPQPGDLLIATPSGPTPDLLASRLAEGTAILAINPSDTCVKALYAACRALPDSLNTPQSDPKGHGKGHGLILHGTRLLLAVPRPEMAFTSYSIRF